MQTRQVILPQILLSLALAACSTSTTSANGTSGASNTPEPPPEVTPTPPGFPHGKPDSRLPEIAEALKNNEEKWRKAGISDYTYTLQQICFCLPEFTAPRTLTIKTGKVVDAKSEVPSTSPPGEGPKNYTIEELFAEIEQAIASKVEKLDVSFDPEYGYPASIQIDVSQMIADEERGLRASNLKPLP